MNNQNLFIGIFLFFCLPTFILGQEAEKYKGMWKGELNDSVEIFEYILNILTTININFLLIYFILSRLVIRD